MDRFNGVATKYLDSYLGWFRANDREGDKLCASYMLLRGALLERMVGVRGMISNVQIEAMRKIEGVDWITALKNGAIAKLADRGQLQLDLFDERNLFSFTSEDYPGERLVACRNPEFAKRRAAKRKDPIAARGARLRKVAGMGRRRQACRAG